MSLDTEVLIIGGGMSGLGLAVQMIRKFGVRNFEIIEKSDDVGGTWLVNTYPGCGCDVASHFYSYSFALNPDWSRKYSMRPELQKYFKDVAEQYKILQNVRFHSTVEKATWDESTATWLVTIKDHKTKQTVTRRCKILISAVGALSVPRACETPGVESFEGKLFHSAKWDHRFDWQNKDVVVLGNGCSATQFVPIMSGGPKATKKLTQFSRQSHWLSERENPYYSSTFINIMRYVPLAMRIYRAKLYIDMEKDFAGFDIVTGQRIRSDLVKTTTEYMKRTSPKKYWDALIPKTEVGCKRKVLDTDYLACLHRPNVELVANDPVEQIIPSGVRTKSGREVKADAIVLATGFATSQMLFPMDIRGKNGISLNDHWDTESQGVAQAYFGTCVPNFPNFFIMMGPNTTTGHLSVIYTVECQINFTLRVIGPILKTLPAYRKASILPSLSLFDPSPKSIEVKPEAARNDSAWTQREAKKLVWSSGCTNWALDPKTGMNIMMYPDWQFWYWWRSVFFKKQDFIYKDAKSGKEVDPWGMSLPGLIARTAAVGLLVGGGLVAAGVVDRDAVEDGARHLVVQAKDLVHWR